MKRLFKNAFHFLATLSQSRSRERIGMLALGMVGFGVTAEAQPTLPTDSVSRPLMVHRDTSIVIWPDDFLEANGIQLTLANLAAVEAITGDLATQAELDAGLALKADAAGNATDAELAAHTGDTANPHSVTKTQVGLANVDNTSDAAKPVSTATQTALNLKASLAALAAVINSGFPNDAAALVDWSQLKNVPAGFADNSDDGTGGSSGTVTSVGLSLPAIFSVSGSPVTTAGTLSATLASQTQNLILAAPDGSSGLPVFRALVLADLPSTLSTDAERAAALAALTKSDVGLSNVDNTSDAAKPVSTATQTALNLKAALADLIEVINSGDPNSGSGLVDWSQLENVPAGFEDGTDDGSGGNTTSDLAGGTELTSGVDYFDTLSTDKTLTVTGSTTDGATTSLTFDCASEVEVTIWSSYRVGETSATTGPLVFAAGNHKIAWERKDGRWYVIDSAVDDETANLVYASPDGSAGKPLMRALVVNDMPSAMATDSEVTSGLSGKQDADGDLDTYAGITPSANIQSLLAAANYAAIRALLDLETGTDFNAYDADLATYAGITPSANVQAVLAAANYAAMRALLDLEAGTDFNAYSANLATWSGVAPGANVGTFLATPSSANLRSAMTDESGTGALLFAGGAFGTPLSITLTNGTGLPASGLAASTSTAVGFGSINLGHASDTTIARSAAGVVTVEGVRVSTVGSQSGTQASPTTTNPLAPTWTTAAYPIWYGATGEIDLPAASGYTGRGLVIYNTGAFTITVDPNASEVIVRDGTVQTGGVSFTLDSGAGNYVALISDGARWITLGYKGELAEGS